MPAATNTKEVNGTAAAIPSTHTNTPKKNTTKECKRERDTHTQSQTHTWWKKETKMHEHEKDETEKINIAS